MYWWLARDRPCRAVSAFIHTMNLHHVGGAADVHDAGNDDDGLQAGGELVLDEDLICCADRRVRVGNVVHHHRNNAAQEAEAAEHIPARRESKNHGVGSKARQNVGRRASFREHDNCFGFELVCGTDGRPADAMGECRQVTIGLPALVKMGGS